MSGTPKASLIDRLVRDRLLAGQLDKSAIKLLQLGEGSAEATISLDPETPINATGKPENPGQALASTATPARFPDLRPEGQYALHPIAPVPPEPVSPENVPPPPEITNLAPDPALVSPPWPDPDGEEVDDHAPPPSPPAGNKPHIDAAALERGGMIDFSRPRSRISEEFRLLQRHILGAAFGPGAEPGFSNLLMVTSARPREGKSFASINLAGNIARQGDHNVLLMDGDPKQDSLCRSLGIADWRGLLDLVANPKLDPEPLIVKTPIDRLSILPIGRERDRSAELLSGKEMIRLIQSLGRRFADRLLILDAPPCLSTSDPAAFAPVVGQILFIVEADRTQRNEVEASLDLIQACPNISLVLNKQQISSRFTFGAHSSYYSS